MLTGIWYWLASSATSMIFAVLALSILIRLGYHREPNGRLGRRRMGSVLGLAASSYTFVVCVVSQLLVKGPSISELIVNGFGNDRVAWLLLILTFDQCFRLWDEYRPHDPVDA
jgi:hypothetical protein